VYGSCTALLLALIIAFGAMSIHGIGADAPRDALTESIVALERAVNALATPSSDYQKILRDLLPALPHDAPAFVKSDIATFLRRAPEAGRDFPCGADFVRARARKELLRVKDVLLDANPQPARPEFCSSNPIVVDETQPEAPIEIYGYDFDREPFQLLLMNDFGFRDITFAITRRAHYHLTVDLEKGGVRISRKSQRIALTLDHLIHHAIPVVGPDTRVCSARIEEIREGKTIAYAPPPVHRDANPDVSVQVWANAALDFESNVVNAMVCMTGVELGGDRWATSGCAAEYVYTSDPDWSIEWISGDLEAAAAFVDKRRDEHVERGARAGPVARWTFRRMNGRPGAAREGQLAVRLNSLRVAAAESGNCVSPILYLEARRNGTVGAETVRRLDPQLKGIDPKILRLRPRFSQPPHSRR
jgi:hypothetical protein